MAQSLSITSLITFFILSLFLIQSQASNRQTLIEPTDQNHSLPLSENHQNMKTDEEDELEPAFVRETGHGYGLYGRRHYKSHTNNEEDDNANESSDDNDHYYYNSDAYGNRNGRFR
ncbi:uncharacterized protein LOC111828949 [Capsella rubella]|uniref:uncharacterized protein LOC111828949 n=1 Tax=Capsella rubella TaxID=81985 RepID=UPI000CD4F3EF|nr:uncharacterized protein LOC111828949 [Capsella rubella]